MAQFSNLLSRRDGLSTDNPTAFYLLLTFTILFFLGLTTMSTLAVVRKIRRSRHGRDDIESSSKSHRRNHAKPSISIINEKSAFLEDGEYSPTDSVPEIRITFPEEQSPDGKRLSRVVIVKIGEKGSIGYEPYEEPLPVYKEKESPEFKNLDLERIGGLKEKDNKS